MNTNQPQSSMRSFSPMCILLVITLALFLIGSASIGIAPASKAYAAESGTRLAATGITTQDSASGWPTCKVTSVSRKGKKLTIKWSKASGVDGYRIQVSNSPEFWGGKSVVISRTIKQGTKSFKQRKYKGTFNLSADVLYVRVCAMNDGFECDYSAARVIAPSKIHFTAFCPVKPSKGPLSQEALRFPGKITKVRSSNSRIVGGEVTDWNNDSGILSYVLLLNCKRPGKAKVTFKSGDKSFVVYVTSKKWKSPLKTFTVGNANYAKKLANYNFNAYCGLPVRSFAGKVSLKTASGWRLVQLDKINDDGQEYLANGQTINKSEGIKSIFMVFVNVKNGATYDLQIGRE